MVGCGKVLGARSFLNGDVSKWFWDYLKSALALAGRDKLKCHTLVCCSCSTLARRFFLKRVAKKNARRKRYLKRMKSRVTRANVKKIRRLKEART